MDAAGYYGGGLFAGTRNPCGIYRIDEIGNATLFADYPVGNACAIADIEFDNGLRYGGFMYAVISVSGSAYADQRGVFAVDTNGNFTKFLPKKFSGGDVTFDTTEKQLFYGDMIASTVSDIFLVDPSGAYVKLLSGEGIYISDIAIGPDGALYVLWIRGEQDMYYVDRIVAIPEPVAVNIDIKPTSCPNPLNIKSSGVLPVAILGSDDVDVNEIVEASILLAGVDAIRYSFEDVAGLVLDPNDCNCTTDGPDGFLDLTLKFETQRIAEAMGQIGQINDGETWILELTGMMLDERPIAGSDCVIIRDKHKSR